MRLRAAMVAFCLAAACTTPASRDDDRGERIVAARRADVDALVTAITTLHPEPFLLRPEPAWRAEVERLRDEARNLSDDQFRVRIGELANLGERNGHTGVFPTAQPPTLRMLPVRLYFFDDGGWHVVAAKDPSLVGTRGELAWTGPVGMVANRLRPMVPADNDSTLLARLAQYLVVPAFTGGELGAVDATPRQRRISETVTPAEWAAFADVDVPQIPLALPRPPWAPQ